MQCETCGATIEAGDVFQHAGKTLCEDCYLDAAAVPKTCDPWAVHSAKTLSAASGQTTLTPDQERLLQFICGRGPLSAPEICGELGIDEKEFQRQFATLRHMELARGFKEGDRVLYTRFSDEDAPA